MRWLAIVALVGCGAPTPHPTPARLEPPAPDAALVVPPARYADDACEPRLATMRVNFSEALAADLANNDGGDLPIASAVDGVGVVGVDPELPVLWVVVRDGRKHPHVTVDGAHVSLETDRWVDQTLAVLVRSGRGGLVDLSLPGSVDVGIDELPRLITALGELGPVRLPVRHPIPSRMAPLHAWVPERARQIVSRATTREAAERALYAATAGCNQLHPALDAGALREDHQIAGERMRHVVAALVACKCAAADVDALEALLLAMLDRPSYELGWLRFLPSTTGTPIPAFSSVRELVAGLAALTPEQRKAGVRLGP